MATATKSKKPASKPAPKDWIGPDKGKAGRKPRKSSTARTIIKAVPGNPFAGVEHLFGSHSFPPLKGKTLKKHVRARILSDHNT